MADGAAKLFHVMPGLVETLEGQLAHLIDGFHVVFDFLGHRGLFFGSTGDLGVHDLDAFHCGSNGIQGSDRLRHLLHRALCDFVATRHRIGGALRCLLQTLDHALDLGGGLVRAAGKGTDFIGDHGKQYPEFPVNRAVH